MVQDVLFLHSEPKFLRSEYDHLCLWNIHYLGVMLMICLLQEKHG
jgi:hypothetical protein